MGAKVTLVLSRREVGLHPCDCVANDCSGCDEAARKAKVAGDEARRLMPEPTRRTAVALAADRVRWERTWYFVRAGTDAFEFRLVATPRLVALPADVPEALRAYADASIDAGPLALPILDAVTSEDLSLRCRTFAGRPFPSFAPSACGP